MSDKAMTWALRDAPGVPSQAAMTLMGLASHADEEGKGSHPAQKTLMRYARKGDRQVRRDLVALEEAGLIRKGDQSLVAHYPADRRPVVWDLAMELSQPADPDYDRIPTSGRARPTGRTRPVVYDRPDVHDRADVEDKTADQDGRTSTTGRTYTSDKRTTTTKKTSSSRDSSNTPRSAKRPPKDAVAPRFDDFWSVYPRRKDIGPAEKAWTKAINERGADPQVVIDAALEYAMKRKGQDPKWTKLPATWINARCWLDEPDPAYTPDDGMLPGFPMPAQRSGGYRNPSDPNAYEGLLQ